MGGFCCRSWAGAGPHSSILLVREMAVPRDQGAVCFQYHSISVVPGAHFAFAAYLDSKRSTASLGRWMWTRSSLNALRSIDSMITGIPPFLLGGVLVFLVPFYHSYTPKNSAQRSRGDPRRMYTLAPMCLLGHKYASGSAQ
ncbi:hypothetical protein N7510_005623 [Penicillium lagena]|uniref:uncharacterized protein n=1 Tax=Penicillium lagena TaxID=94218 RepID=UPI00253F7E1E|nr:uncharacterized protein N7510_005623 [Penicillium lagena]KAJ5612429.1 hypothetical protein N7510_005623 [Penicillium lagena]